MSINIVVVDPEGRTRMTEKNTSVETVHVTTQRDIEVPVDKNGEGLLSRAINRSMEMLQQQKVMPTKKKIKFIVKLKITVLKVSTNPISPDYKEKFISWLKANKDHPYWKSSQISTHKHTKHNEPIFGIVNPRKNTTLQTWLKMEKNENDIAKLYELGDPLKKQHEGGLRWEDIRDYIYNSGEFEEPRKKNGFDSKLKQNMFFPSGKTDSGRTITQFLYRLWFIVNKLE
jgi:hypothetical protein